MVDRFWAKVHVRGLDDCWFWTAGVSRSGRREVDYGCIRHGRRGSIAWRANRLALILATAPQDVPRDVDESEGTWLLRARHFYAADEASHTCDRSLCCNPRHLKWETHAANVTGQRWRRERRRSED